MDRRFAIADCRLRIAIAGPCHSAGRRLCFEGCGGWGMIQTMVQVLAATFKDGVFKPDEKPALAESARVRLVVEPIDGDEPRQRAEAWDTLQRLWTTSTFNSGGDRLNRERLHERG